MKRQYADEDYNDYVRFMLDCLGKCEFLGEPDPLWAALCREQAAGGAPFAPEDGKYGSAGRRRKKSVLQAAETKKLHQMFDSLRGGADSPRPLRIAAYRAGGSYCGEKELRRYRERADAVLLYNVLYDLPVWDWPQALNRFFSMVRDGGILVFSEEKIYRPAGDPYGKSGYLLLGGEEIRRLFPGRDTYAAASGETGRVWTYVIRKGTQGARMKIICEDVRDTLRTLEESLWRILSEDREPGSGHGLALEDYGFYCRQYVHVRRARRQLESHGTAEEIRAGSASH